MSKPPTIEALDRMFREYVKRQPSCLSGRFSEYHDGVGFSIACHVRRAAHGGTGIKPLFWCVPMTNDEHRTQSNQGELQALLTHGGQHGVHATVAYAKEWFDEQAELYRNRWLATQPPEVQKIVREAL